VALALTPNLVAVGAFGHGSQIMTAAYLPLLLLLYDRFARRGSWLALSGFGLYAAAALAFPPVDAAAREAVLLSNAGVVAAQVPAPLTNVIVTQGEATLKRAPDRAWLTVSTEARDPRATEARKKNAEAMTIVQGVLKGAGVSADALRTNRSDFLEQARQAFAQLPSTPASDQ
jgi:hypothetical protein